MHMGVSPVHMCRRQGVSRVRIGGDRRRLGRVTRAKVASGWAAGGGRLGLSWPGHCVQTAGRAAPRRPTRRTSCRRRLERDRPALGRTLPCSLSGWSAVMECRLVDVEIADGRPFTADCFIRAPPLLRRVSTARRLAGARTRARRPDPRSRYLFVIPAGQRARQGRAHPSRFTCIDRVFAACIMSVPCIKRTWTALCVSP